MSKIAAAFNPHFLAHGPIKPALDVSLIELGLSEALQFRSSIPLSLHLARTPIVEEPQVQKNFIDYLESSIRKIRRLQGSKLQSIGIHLSGSRFENIGRFGLTSHFAGSDENIRRAKEFVQRIQDQVHLPAWIENANFYSGSREEVVENWQATQEICKATGSGIILDLAHLIIDCHNVGLHPFYLLGKIDFSSVLEIHLSGIRKGSDNTLHDSHSLPVHEEIWDMLVQIRSLNLIDEGQTYINIEHSDFEWEAQVEQYYADFEKLKHLLGGLEANSKKQLPIDRYAKSYLKRILLQMIPNLRRYLQQNKIDFDQVFESWIKEVLHNTRSRLCLTEVEVSPNEAEFHIFAPESFISHLKKMRQT